jgi:hypothetical protein
METRSQTTLPENAGLAYAGEPGWAPAVVTPRQVETLRTAANPTGRPNSDVLIGFLGLADNQFQERWQVDFAAHLTAQEAELYEEPFALLGKKCGKTKEGVWWINPQANAPMRSALARLDRFLVTPVTAERPRWTWLDAGWLPDQSLLAVARDDDFTQGVLQSRVFAAWWQAGGRSENRVQVVESFPFPWPSRTPYGALTGAQQTLRFEAARAARNGDTAQLDAIVINAYGFQPSLEGDELILALRRLQLRRTEAGK